MDVLEQCPRKPVNALQGNTHDWGNPQKSIQIFWQIMSLFFFVLLLISQGAFHI